MLATATSPGTFAAIAIIVPVLMSLLVYAFKAAQTQGRLEEKVDTLGEGWVKQSKQVLKLMQDFAVAQKETAELRFEDRISNATQFEQIKARLPHKGEILTAAVQAKIASVGDVGEAETPQSQHDR